MSADHLFSSDNLGGLYAQIRDAKKPFPTKEAKELYDDMVSLSKKLDDQKKIPNIKANAKEGWELDESDGAYFHQWNLVANYTNKKEFGDNGTVTVSVVSETRTSYSGMHVLGAVIRYGTDEELKQKKQHRYVIAHHFEAFPLSPYIVPCTLPVVLAAGFLFFGQWEAAAALIGVGVSTFYIMKPIRPSRKDHWLELKEKIKTSVVLEIDHSLCFPLNTFDE